MEPDRRVITRREWMKSAVSAAVWGTAGCSRARFEPGPRDTTPVAILRAASYRVDLLDRMLRGAAACGLEARASGCC